MYFPYCYEFSKFVRLRLSTSILDAFNYREKDFE